MIEISGAMRRRDLLAAMALAAALPSAARAADEKKKKKSGGENYVQIDTLIGTTNKAGGRRGVLTVDCGLEVDDAKLREYAELSLPRLRAAYVQVVQTYAAGLPSGSEPNADYIVQSLQRQTDLILKRPGARLLVGAIVAN
jgi:hypothetical protein